ncbi:MAG: protein kinase domain-containing protein [Nannocystaceae bacterium]|nr:serine/threonine-protein kinase [bacterium]
MTTPGGNDNTPTSTLFWSPERVQLMEPGSEESEPCMVSIAPPASTLRTVTESPPDVTLHPSKPFALRAGDRIPESRIELGERIGVGATAVVYRGRHVDLDRPLAVKVLKRGASWAEARERFLAEARLTSELHSAYVVDVVDFGTLPDGRMWSAMELLEGRSLADEIDEGPMSVERTVALLRMACKGLHAAHCKGVVHRDIKPDNMMLIERRGRERLVLVDFGIATSESAPNDERCGTPRYMSPEQIIGTEVDGRADLYALGCCAYEMLTGEILVREDSVDDALEAHVSGVKADFRGHDAVPDALRSVVERCLQTEPSERYASAAELEAALCEVQFGEALDCPTGVLALPDIEDPTRRRRLAHALAFPEHAQGTSGRRKVGLAAAALVGFALLGAGFAQNEVATLDNSTMMRTQHVAAAAAGALATPRVSQPAVAAALPQPRPEVSEDVPPPPPPSFKLSSKPSSRPRPAADARTAGPTKAPAAAPEAPASEPTWNERRRARVEVRRGNRAAKTGASADARKHFEKALALDPRRADAHAGLADLDFDAGHHRAALRHARLAVRLSPRNAEHRIRLGDSYLRLSQRAKARAQYQRAQSLGSRIATRRLETL